jgi:hypothetical protein
LNKYPQQFHAAIFGWKCKDSPQSASPGVKKPASTAKPAVSDVDTTNTDGSANDADTTSKEKKLDKDDSTIGKTSTRHGMSHTYI